MRAVVWIMLLTFLPTHARATDVLVRVSGVVGQQGVVRVAVCLPAEYATKTCTRGALAPARPGTADVLVRDVPPGRYAVLVHHDRAGDGVVHTNWLGIPIDGVGVSRNAIGHFGPPGFDQAALDVTGPHVTVEIALRREPES